MTLRPEPYEHLRNDAVYDAIEQLAELGDPAVLAFAWLLGDERVTAVIVGPRRPEQLEPALRALEHDVDRAAVSARAPLLLP
jgi:aryl-alcohol dehydrogenase-like predicted oxidoreductase